MKSKKIIAMIVAFAAFMAVATSGLAAVTTTTTYNTVSGKVEVEVDVTGATAGSEVTYLVKSNNDIVYIDQKTATDGTVDFDYKIDKSKIVDLETDVQFGTNGDDAITGSDATIQLSNITVTQDGGVESIELFIDEACNSAATTVTGDGDELYARVIIKSDYKVVETTGLGKASANVYPVEKGATEIAVTTESTYVAPGVDEPDNITIEEPENPTVDKNGDKVEAQVITKVLKVVGQPTEVGVRLGGYEFPALAMGSTKDKMVNYSTTDGLCAVRIIVGKDVVLDELQAYYK